VSRNIGADVTVAADAYHRAARHHLNTQDELSEAKEELRSAQEQYDMKVKKLAEAVKNEAARWADVVMARMRAYPDPERCEPNGWCHTKAPLMYPLADREQHRGHGCALDKSLPEE
jgi:hypothetical protein